MTLLPETCAMCGRLRFPDDVVTIPRSTYEELIRKGRQVDAFADRVRNYRATSPRSRIPHDLEVADFIVQSRSSMLIREIRVACLEKFGADRTPSRSAIHRFIQAVGG